MTKEILKRANELEGQINYWEDQARMMKGVISSPSYYHLGFDSEYSHISLDTDANSLFMVPFAKDYLAYVELKLQELRKEFEKL